MATAQVPGIGEVASLFNEIEGLQAQVQIHLAAIQEIYGRIARAAGGGSSKRGRKPKALVMDGAPGATGRVPGKRRKKRAKRGALRAALQQVLGGGKVMGCAEIVHTLLKAGYTTASNPKVFYNTVYLALKSNKGIEKTKQGFKLQAQAAKPGKSRKPGKPGK